ncbi:MAG: Hsp20/alpha crystallin family protein [Clostridia bacterium]|nr:Hsp20/alpha crystallin family protein [Clostridia bacterium]
MFGLTPFNSRKQNGLVRKNDIFDLRSVFDEFFNDSFFPGFFPSEASMRADIRETEKEYIVEVEIPGAKKEEVKLELRDDVLTVAVERNEEISDERENYIRKERRFGSYSRSFYVENVKNEAVTARYENGVLSVILPKQEGAKRKEHRIEIQ